MPVPDIRIISPRPPRSIHGGRLTPSDYASARRQIQRDRPGWLEAWLPKRYDVLQEYQSAYTWAVAALSSSFQRDFTQPATVSSSVYGQSCYLRHLGVPMLFVGAELVQAALRTELPLNLPMDDLRFGTDQPFGGAVFMIPRGVLVHATEGSCPYLAVTRIAPRQLFFPPLREIGQPVAVQKDAHIVTTSQPEHTVNYTYGRVVDHSPGRTLGEALTALGFHLEVSSDLLDYADTSETSMANSATYTARVGNLALMLVLLLRNSPDLVEPGTLLKRVASKRNGEPAKEFWSPTFFGRLFKMETKIEGAIGEPTGRTHRPHFVRGHLRQQAIGPHWSQRKLIWVRPFKTGIS